MGRIRYFEPLYILTEIEVVGGPNLKMDGHPTVFMIPPQLRL